MRRFLGLDTETTGLNADKGDKIIEVALLTYSEDGKLVDRYVQRIDPERSISAGAQAIHGIAYDDLVGEPKFRDVALDIRQRFEDADALVTHNSEFDLGFFIAEFQDAGVPLVNRPVIDTMLEARWACPEGKCPRLEELCFALGVEFDTSKAHGAEYDTARMMAAFFEGVRRGFFHLPKVAETI